MTLVERWRGTLTDDPAAPAVLVLPGAGYPVELPGLFHPCRALALAGWQVWTARWQLSGADAETATRTVLAAVAEQITSRGSPDLLLAKSVGTLAAPWAVEHQVPGVWTTPLLGNDTVARALRHTTTPGLLVAGTNDQAWDESVAEHLAEKLQVVRLPGADHGWGQADWRAEFATLQALTEAVVRFASGVQQPASPAAG